MGLLQKLFPGKTAAVKQAAAFFETLNYRPIFHDWRGAIYEQEQVRAAIDALARHTAKLEFTIQGSAKQTMQGKLPGSGGRSAGAPARRRQAVLRQGHIHRHSRRSDPRIYKRAQQDSLQGELE